METLDFQKINNIHFIGIGGVGMSALAQLFLEQGKGISGSDSGESKTIEMLRERGVEISIGHSVNNVPSDADLVIYSDAVKANNVERVRAGELSKQTLSYFEALGKVASEYYLIAVSGAHGKTTTTAMLADVLEDAGLDPTVVVGSIRARTKSNFRAGKSNYFVVEADEYMRHFLNFTPKVLIILNIDGDHLDYYKDIADIQSAFGELVSKIPEDGFLICNPKGPNMDKVTERAKCKVVDYTLYIQNDLALKAPGNHNRSNAGAVLAAAEVLGIERGKSEESLKNFAGTWRRFEYKGETEGGALVYDDYAHHPTEITATLQAAREKFSNKKIILVFQPHLYSRTKLLKDEFIESLSKADVVLLAPIYAAREAKDESITSEMLVEEISKKTAAKSFNSLKEIEEHLKTKKADSNSVIIITMGAGDIYKVGESLVKNRAPEDAGAGISGQASFQNSCSPKLATAKKKQADASA
jgi:UDP-N-acetylmuramate--alanine ligase